MRHSIWIWAIVAGRLATATLLNENPGFSALDSNCERDCLAPQNSTSIFGLSCSADDDRCFCGNLSTSIKYVQSCAFSECDSNTTEVFDALSFVASFCTSAASAGNYLSILPPVTVTFSEVSTVITSATASTTAVSLAGPSTPPTGSGGTSIPFTVASHATPSPISTSAAPTATGSLGANSTASTLTSARKSGLSEGAKVGIGVGVGLGVPILLAAIVALILTSRPRKIVQSGGPYGEVMINGKGTTESYSSPNMELREMHHLESAAPFLPGVVRRDSESDEPAAAPTVPLERSVEPVGSAEVSEEQTEAAPLQEQYEEVFADMKQPLQLLHIDPLATQPLSASSHRQDLNHLMTTRNDEPPSPVSPVSPISLAGSRPPSPMHDRDHDDL